MRGEFALDMADPVNVDVIGSTTDGRDVASDTIFLPPLWEKAPEGADEGSSMPSQAPVLYDTMVICSAALVMPV